MSEETTLANGLTVLLRPTAGDQLSFCLAVRAGARTDPPGQSGLAHLLEHCYALGSRALGLRGLDLMVERAGGTRGALTTPDVTLHFTTLPAASLSHLLHAEADRFESLTLPEREVGYERDIVLHEVAQRTTRSPTGALVHRLLALAFLHHPYRNPVVGRPDEVRALRLADVRACYLRHYVPANAVVVLAGGFDPVQARSEIEQGFGRIAPADLPRIDVEEEPEQTAARRDAVTHQEAAAPRVAMLWKVPPLDHPETPALLLAEKLLELALPQGRFRHWLLRDAGVFTCYAEGGDTAALEDRASVAIEQLAAGRLTEKWFAAARLGAAKRLPATAELLARFAATSASHADWLDGLEKRQAALGPAEVAAAARRHLRPERLSIVRMAPA